MQKVFRNFKKSCLTGNKQEHFLRTHHFSFHQRGSPLNTVEYIALLQKDLT